MKKALRLALGTLLPVLLYCAGAALLNIKEISREDPDVMGRIAFIWLGYGFMIMGIPSILYSVAIEYVRAKRENLMECILTGAILGFASGSVLLVFDVDRVVLLTMSLPGALIGATIPLILWPIKQNSEPVGAGQPHLRRRKSENHQ